MNLFIAPFINALFWFNNLTGSLGWSIVIVTVLIRLILLPLVIPSLRSAKKMKELQPKLRKIQEQAGKDKQRLATMQMELYKKEGINPLSGCLPQVLQIAVLLMFFTGFNMVTKYAEGKGGLESLNANLIESLRVKPDFKFETTFLGSNMVETPGKIFKEKGLSEVLLLPLILLLGSAIMQFYSSKLMMPASAEATVGKSAVDQSAYTKATEGKEDDMMEAMRVQSTYMMPLMTVFFGWNFSVGLLLYWFVNSLTMLIQQLGSEKIVIK